MFTYNLLLLIKILFSVTKFIPFPLNIVIKYVTPVVINYIFSYYNYKEQNKTKNR